MLQSNFVDDFHRADERLIQQDVILNSNIVADVAAFPNFASKYISAAEVKIAASYTIRLENEQKNLYKDGAECEQHTCLEDVIFVGQAHGRFTTTRIGETIPESYVLYMSPDRSFQGYKRVFYKSCREKTTRFCQR